MSAEKPTKAGIALTSDQAKKAIETMISKWNGEKGIQLSGGVLEELIEKHGAQVKLAEVLRKIKEEEKGKKE